MAILSGFSFLGSLLVCRFVTTKSDKPAKYVVIYTLAVIAVLAAVP